MKWSLLLAFPGVLTGCSAEEQRKVPPPHKETLHTFQEPHMGILFTLRVWAEEGQLEDLTTAKARAFKRIEKLNRALSDYLPESEINDLARAPSGQPVPVSDDLFHLFRESELLWKQTNGAFDITAGPLIRLWRRSKKNRELPTAEELARAQARTGFDHLTLDPVRKTVTKRVDGMLFDLGGIAKGYAADEALRILRKAGFPRSLVAASGDIAVGDPPPGKPGWKIGIETLDIGTDLSTMPTVTLSNRAISTSADTRRYFVLDGVRYSHIVSPKTGLGLTERIGASVIAPTATESDSHATAVTILGKKEGLQFIRNQREIECRIIALREGKEVIFRSDGFPRFQEENQEEAVSAP